MPRLSVIVTSYNIEDYIEQCLASVVAQTLVDIEIIVVDDGSSDSTPQIIRRFAAEDPRIVPVLLKENTVGGVATAANTGLDRATAPYVGFVDGDDVYEPEMFELLLDAADHHDADLAMCNYRLLDESTGEHVEPADRSRWSSIDREFYDLDTETRKRFLKFVAVPWRKIYRRSMLDEHGIRFPVGDYFFEDNPFHWFNVISADRIAVVPEVLCTHRVARAGQTMGTVDEKLFKIFEHHTTIRCWLVDRDLLEIYKSTLLGWLISQLEWIGQRTPTNLRRQLFDIAADHYSAYDQRTIDQALAEGEKGPTARDFSTAITRRNYAGFNRALDSQSRNANLVVRAAYHLRYSGVRRTMWLGSRFVVNAVRNRRTFRNQPKSLDLDDVVFGLTVLQSRINQLDRRLDEIIDALDDRR